MDEAIEVTDCPDCGVSPNESHKGGCDVERCYECGGQLISCDCSFQTEQLPWSGEWPGVAECREFGWYSKPTPIGWKSCSKDDPGASEDLNRLHVAAIWDKSKGRYVLPIIQVIPEGTFELQQPKTDTFKIVFCKDEDTATLKIKNDVTALESANLAILLSCASALCFCWIGARLFLVYSG